MEAMTQPRAGQTGVRKGDPRHQVRPGRIRRVLREITQPDCRQPLLELRSVGSEP